MFGSEHTDRNTVFRLMSSQFREMRMTKMPNLDGVVVLVVDDNSDSRDLIKRVLENNGASVVTAGTGQEALQIVEKTPPDVLLSDIGLPEMDGYTLIKKIRTLEQNKRKHIPAAAITAFTSPEDRGRSFMAGFRFHLAKPVNFSELLKIVANLAGRSGSSA